MRDMRVLTFLLIGALAACSQERSSTGPQQPKAVLLDVVSGASQSAGPGQALPLPLVVKVVDASLRVPIPGYLVNWVVTSGGGTMFVGATETNWLGITQNYLTLGPTPGAQSVEVRAVSPMDGAKEVFATFIETAIAPVTSEINTTIGWDGNRQIGMFGALPATTAAGQSFTTPTDAPLLNSFTFWLNAGGGWQPNIIFAAYVMAWDGTKTTGPVLWTSGPFAGPTSYMQRYNFKVPSLALNPGAQYIAFLSTIPYLSQFPSNAQVLIGYVYNPYLGGRAYFASPTASFAQLSLAPWLVDAGGDFDAAFIADFSSVPLAP